MTFKVQDDWLIPFLQCVRSRPGMILGNEMVRTLATFISGYAQAREDLGIPAFGESEGNLLDSFSHWLAGKLRSQRSLRWAGHVEFLDPSEHNIWTFFRLLDEFAAEEGLDIHTVRATWPPDSG